MARQVIIDCDPGIDDATALCMALFNPEMEVVAITAVEGNVDAEQSSRNVQAIVEHLDPPRYPRFGSAAPLSNAPAIDARMFHGGDGLANWNANTSSLHHQHPAEKVICDVVRSAPQDITIITLGPLTNIARALNRDPEIATMIGELVIMGGSLNGIGNVTPAAEFNMYYDPEAARTVFHSRTTKTLVPLDVTNQVALSWDFVNELPSADTRAGSLLHHIVPFAFRTHRQRLGMERIVLHDVVALLVASNASLFTTEGISGDVETCGEISTGATVFDRRPCPDRRPNMEIVQSVDVAGATDSIIRELKRAGRAE
jgi:inosine-uridine nucleoside N-ribohydrolase